jgi:ubiquinone/menaquinone biosynthesis C-methylase UbiE
MNSVSKPRKKAYKSLPMEGMLATWYAKNTARDLPEFEADAARIAERLSPVSHVLEIAPGPGYLAIALAGLGAYRIAGLDISQSFVRIAAENAAKAGVAIDFQRGDAAAMPYPSGAFDFIVCRAAFKNFSDPVGALREMHRVLRPGGEALIIDMRKDASNAAIDSSVDAMKAGRMDAFIIRAIFKYSLRRRAYSRADFLRMAAATPFGAAEIDEAPIGYDVWLRKARASG